MMAAAAKKGWIAENPYRAGFLALALIMVGMVVGFCSSAQDRSSTPEAGPDPATETTAPVTTTRGPDGKHTFLTHFPSGEYLVGSHITKGVYVSEGGQGTCTWKRTSAIQMEPLESGTAESGEEVRVRVDALDWKFISDSCGIWTKVE